MRLVVSSRYKTSRSPTGKPYTPSNHFTICHQVKQRLLLRALNEMDARGETAAETKAVVEMITRLEEILSVRKRRYTLQPVTRRKRSTYGTQKLNTAATCEEGPSRG